MNVNRIRLAKLVRSLLQLPGAWTKNSFARPYPSGPSMPADTPSATCWCLVGAALKVSRDKPELREEMPGFLRDVWSHAEPFDPLWKSREKYGLHESLFAMQDSRDFTHQMLLELLDIVIKSYDPDGRYDPAGDALVDHKHGG